jgi:hypothetical protein
MKKSIVVKRINEMSKEAFEKKYGDHVFRFSHFDWGTFIYVCEFWGYSIHIRFTKF